MVRAPAPTPARRARIASSGCCITPHPPRPHSFSDTLALTIHSLILLLLIRLLILTVGILRPAHLATAAGVVFGLFVGGLSVHPLVRLVAARAIRLREIPPPPAAHPRGRVAVAGAG